MVYTINASSDIVGGIVALCIAALSFQVGYFYKKLHGKSLCDYVNKGNLLEISSKSLKKIRNSFGLIFVLLLSVFHLISLCLEFGLTGTVADTRANSYAIVLGGGRRFNAPISDLDVSEDDFFLSSISIPDLFEATIGSCLTTEINSRYKMFKTYYPAIKLESENSQSISELDFPEFECTSTWYASCEWSNSNTQDISIPIDSLEDQIIYPTAGISEQYHNVYAVNFEDVTISYGRGNSYDGEISPVVVLSNGGMYSYAICVTREDDHFVYSIVNDLTENDGVLSGIYLKGHIRTSEYSLGGVLTLIISTGMFDLSDFSTVSDIVYNSYGWWESEIVSYPDFNTITFSSYTGMEELWPQLSEVFPELGDDYVEYSKPKGPDLYNFKTGEMEVTIVSDWFVVLSILLGILFLVLFFSSMLFGINDGFWTYDGLSKMSRNGDIQHEFSVIGFVGENKQIGFVRGTPISPMEGL